MDKKTSHIGINERLSRLWDFFSDIILEPFLFAFVVFMLFSRLQAIISYIVENPTYSFWKVLEVDVQLNPSLCIGFISVFTLWMTSKGVKYQKERSDKKQLSNTLEEINTNIEDLQQVIKDLSDRIEDLPNEIVESMKPAKNEDNESE